MNLVAKNLSYKPDEQFHLNEVSFNFKKGNIYTILGRTLSGKENVSGNMPEVMGCTTFMTEISPTKRYGMMRSTRMGKRR